MFFITPKNVELVFDYLLVYRCEHVLCALSYHHFKITIKYHLYYLKYVFIHIRSLRIIMILSFCQWIGQFVFLMFSNIYENIFCS